MDAVRKWAGWIAMLVLASFVLLQVPRGAMLLAVAAAAGGLYWLLRSSKTAKPAEMLSDRGLAGPRLPGKATGGFDPAALARRPLNHVQDVRLAAVILMVQLVRTGGALTAAEKNVIYELMSAPLEIEDRQGMFELAWQMTDRDRVFRQWPTI